MIDLRSDTVTRPTPGMRAAMASAEVGDDVWGDDPTAIRLQARAAALTGKEDALFCTSGTQANLIALITHTRRGEAYLTGQRAHTYDAESGAASCLGGIHPIVVPSTLDVSIDLSMVRGAIPDGRNVHFPRTTLMCLENTFAGQPLPPGFAEEAAQIATERGMKLHLDGARLFNAAVGTGVPVSTLTRSVDSVSFCLSKGLGAPVGSMLCGASDFITEARRWRKALGGGLRQVGVLAAAGLYALDHHVERLADDHTRAARLAAALSALPGLSVQGGANRTNIVLCHLDPARRPGLAAFLAERGVTIDDDAPLRLVTHLDVNDADIDAVIEAFTAWFTAR